MGRFSLILFLLLFLSLEDDAVAGQDVRHPDRVMKPVYFDVSPPLRDLVHMSNGPADESWKEGFVKNNFNFNKHTRKSYDSLDYADQAVQHFQGSYQPLAPLQNFEGVGMLNNLLPPDTHGDVGPNHYFQVVNTSYAIYSKSGTLLLGPNANYTVWLGMPNNANSGDPTVLYDEQADRWLFAQFSLPNGSSAPFYLMIAVSQTPDPTGAWYRYQYSFPDLPDYPKYGIWRDSYFLSINKFTPVNYNWNGAGAAAMNRKAMLKGDPAAALVLFNFPVSDEAGSLLPVDCDGPFPPAGTPGYFAYLSDYITYHLGIYELHADWVTPANSTIGNFTSLPVTSFNAYFTNGIAQNGTTVQLDPLSDRLMYRLQYHVFGDHSSMVCNHTVNTGSEVAGVRWYELRNAGSGWSVYQQSTYAPDANSRWMGSIAMDQNGNMALGYSVSSSSMYPSIYYTGRLSGDAINTMTQAESVIINGGGAQLHWVQRWGDYSSMSVDPTQCGTFWYTQEYYQYTASYDWKTRIASFQLPAGTLTTDFLADNTTPALTDTVAFSDLSAGCPTIWSWSFSPATVTYLSGTTSSSRNPKVKFNSTGIYDVTLSASAGGSPVDKTRTSYIHAGTPGLWTGVTSSDWSTPSNWHNLQVPGAATNITIPASAPFMPSITGDLTVGNQCSSITLSGGNSQLTVPGSLTINSGYSVTVNNSGLIQVGKDWNDYGTFAPGTGTVEFITTSPGKIPGGYKPNMTMNDYYRNIFTVGMRELSGGSAGPTGDDATSVVSIGFNFSYMGINYSQIKISTNGWASLNQSGYSWMYDNVALFGIADPNTTLAPWFDNLGADGTSAITYKTEGSAPDRIFTVEWKNMLSYTGAFAKLNFQLKLYETTNIIEFLYGNVVAGIHHTAEGASIGIEDATGGPVHFIEATTGSRTTGIINLTSSSNWPTVNYRFGPTPLSAENFYNLTISKSGGSFSNEREIIVDGNMTINP
ncbi:MAG: hypothetical protein NTU98_09815 [Bacteroidetes bacterium]|nr:hypothetical protein [Bacteroidota bacterium]